MEDHTITYAELVEAARELLQETIRDPQEGNPEYARGVVNLIAEVAGRYEMDTDTRMAEVAAEIGLAEE